MLTAPGPNLPRAHPDQQPSGHRQQQCQLHHLLHIQVVCPTVLDRDVNERLLPVTSSRECCTAWPGACWAGPTWPGGITPPSLSHPTRSESTSYFLLFSNSSVRGPERLVLTFTNIQYPE